MSAQSNATPTTTANVAETKPNDKEINFRIQEKAIRDKYERELAQERAARLEAEKKAQELARKQAHDDDEIDDEPYIDHKRLKKEQAKLGQQIKQETQTDIQRAVQQALDEERKANWIDQKRDFYDVMQHAEKLYMKDPDLANTILKMPDNFERQQLVYQNIKAFGLHKPEEKKTNIQDTIDAKRKGPYYQPSGIGTAPYASEANFSASGQKDAYTKMQELKHRLRLN